MKKLLILLAFAFLFLSLTSASSFDERKKYLLDYYSKALSLIHISEPTRP